MAAGTETALKSLLRASGLERWVSHGRSAGRLLVNTRYRRLQQRQWAEYFAWRRHAAALRPPLWPEGSQPRRALIVAKGTVHGAQTELGLLKALELAGYRATVLCDRSLDKFFRLGGVREFVRWEDYGLSAPVAAAAALVAKASSVDELLAVQHGGARVGKFAASTAFRALRVGRLDFSLPETRAMLTAQLTAGMARAEAAVRLVDRLQPAVALFMGNRYTGQSELMDICIDAGVDVLTWFDAHRSNSLMLKRYRRENRDMHHGSISDSSWRSLVDMPWGQHQQRALDRELYGGYASGDWYSRGGTQINKTIVDADRLAGRLGLDRGKKTAVIFPHIVWDATLFWGTDLYSNYEDWLVATVGAACANPRLNWIVKVHPAHVSKSAMERYGGEAAEMMAIRERVGALPPHVTVVPPDTDINTFSLFGLMDYCLTVRGTIGIESAALGKRVLTAGSGRYDRRGFTLDSDTREQYLERLARLETIPAPTAHEVDLARRFAYGAFVVRPLRLSAWSITHDTDIEATTRIAFVAPTSQALRASPDIRAVAEWAINRDQEDFLWSPSDLLPQPTMACERAECVST